MSLALFHEYQESHQGVDQVVAGSFSSPGGTEFVVRHSSRLVLYKTVSDGSPGNTLKYIADCDIFSQIHCVAVSRSIDGTCDRLIVSCRNSLMSVLEFDAASNNFRTIAQSCFSAEVDTKPTTGYVSKICRVRESTIVTQFSETTLTFIQLGADAVQSFTVPIKLSETLQLASVDDIQYISETTVAVLGKTESHAWVGRTATITPFCSAVRIVSFDMRSRSITLNWSFESLPSEAFGLVALPAPKGGLLVVSPDIISYCEDFSSWSHIPVNEAGRTIVDRPIHFLRPDDHQDEPIDLDGSVPVVVSEELVLFCCHNRTILACHLVRKQGVFAAVSDIVWERISVERSTVPSSAVIARDQLMIASRHGTSLLFQVSKAQILLPISVFSSLDEEIRLSQMEPSTGLVHELIYLYQQEVHDGKISHSVELGLSDELVGYGRILTLHLGSDTETIMSTSSGDLVSLSTGVPVDVTFELPLKNIKFVFNFALHNMFFLVIGGAGKVLLVECGNGITELARAEFTDPVIDVIRRVTDDEHIVLVTSMGLVTVPVVKEKASPLKQHVVHIWPSPTEQIRTVVKDSSVWIARLDTEKNAIEIGSLDPSNGHFLKKSISLIHPSSPIVSFSLSLDLEVTPVVTIADVNGSISVYRGAILVLFNRYASLCKPVIAHEDMQRSEESETAASQSITDPTRRPLEIHSSTAVFAQKISIVEAKIEFDQQSSSALLFVMIDNRPPLVYKGDVSMSRFFLTVSDSPLLFSAVPTCVGSHIVKFDNISGFSGYLVKTSPTASSVVLIDPRGSIRIHHGLALGFGDFAEFSSVFLSEAAVGIDMDSVLRIMSFPRNIDLKKSVLFRSLRTVDDQSRDERIFDACSSSSSGMALNVVTGEIDPGILVPVASDGSELPPEMMPQEEPDNVMMTDGPEPPVTQSVAVNCPVPATRQRHQIRVMSEISGESVISAVINMEPGEFVTGLVWAESVLGLGSDVLVIGTTMMLGEEAPAQGRIVVARVEATGGTVDPHSAERVAGARILYETIKKTAVSVVKEWKGCIAASLGHKLMMYQWDAVAGRLRGVGMIDLALQISSLSFFKNFIVASDILRGIYLLRYKEDPVMDGNGVVISMAASIQMIAKTMPLQQFGAIHANTVRVDGAVGIVSVDTLGNLDLEIFSPVHFGQYLRHSQPFHLPSPSIAISPIVSPDDTRSLLIGTASGSLCQLVPVREGEHHLASSLVGLMVSLLPQVGGVNPRLRHLGVGRETTLPNSIQAIESIDLLLRFLYLSTPLQAEVASRMKQPIDVLMRAVAGWLRRQ